MTNVLLGTETGVSVEGVGQLFWSEAHRTFHGSLPEKFERDDFASWDGRLQANIVEGSLSVEQHYRLPDNSGFGLTLWLDRPFREKGFEYFDLRVDPIETKLEHFASDVNGGEESTKFLGWFTRFLIDLRDWTKAEQIYCFDDGPERDLPHNAIAIDAGYHWREGPIIKIANLDVFIGSLATHLASLAKD